MTYFNTKMSKSFDYVFVSCVVLCNLTGGYRPELNQEAIRD